MLDLTLEKSLHECAVNTVARKAEFYRYYSDKRVQHQIMQLNMLRDVPGVHPTEIGSYLGFAMGLFSAAGFKVQTIDAAPASLLGELTPEMHIEKNILEIVPEDIHGQEVIVCFEPLEHQHLSDVRSVLEIFHASKAEWILINVHNRCMSVDIRLIKNPFSFLFKSIIKFSRKKIRNLRIVQNRMVTNGSWIIKVILLRSSPMHWKVRGIGLIRRITWDPFKAFYSVSAPFLNSPVCLFWISRRRNQQPKKSYLAPLIGSYPRIQQAQMFYNCAMLSQAG